MLSKENIKHIYGATPMQEGMYFHFLLDRTSTAYFEQKSYRITGTLDVARVEASMNDLMERYDILRTVFVHKFSEKLLQVVLKKRNVDFRYEDASGHPDKDACVADRKQKDKDRSFDLNKDVLMRVTVVQLAEAEYELIWSNPHLILDGWCASILINEFYALYTARLRGQPAVLPPTVPYRNYIQWLEKQDKALAKAYWAGYLAGYEEVASLPRRYDRDGDAYRQQTQVLELTGEKTARLNQLASKCQVTPTTAVQALWALLLARYSGKRDVVFGKVVSGRPAEVEGIESMIGLFINTVPVRVNCAGGTGFSDLLAQVHESALASEPYHYCQLAEIEVGARTAAQLFDHIMVFENYPVVKRNRDGNGADAGSLFGIEQAHSFEQTNYDFSLNVGFGETLSLDFIFNAGVYDPRFIANSIGHFRVLLDEVLDDPAADIDRLAILPAGERKMLLETFNATRMPMPRCPSIPAQFEAQAAATPDAPAVVFEGNTCTYAQLNRQANRLAHHLRGQYGVKPNDLVGLALDRSERMIIGLLGILKAGAAYVPVDMTYPADRIRYILSDAAVAVLLTDSDHLFSLQEYYQGELVALDVQLAELEEAPGNPADPGSSAATAYVMYTSGSTGQPKGVVIPMHAIVNYLHWANAYYFGNRRGHHFGLFTSLSFDLTLTSIFTTLLRGDTLYVYAGDNAAETLADMFSADTAVNCVKMTPSHVSLLGLTAVARTNVTHVILGGEALQAQHVTLLRKLNPGVKIYNEYGPTETTVGCTVMETGSAAEAALIGSPVANAALYVLDEKGRVQPCGVYGELYIGGMGVGRGYWNNPALTAARFTDDPFVPGQKMYRSGDYGRWLPEGNLEFLGRLDQQVKIRGYRIELEEIRQVLLGHEGISDVVVAVHGKGVDSQLAGYYTGVALDAAALKTFAARALPSYMVPSFFVRLEAFPLTPNGKLDRAALPAPGEATTGGRKPFREPRNRTEEVLVQVYAEVFGLEKVSAGDDFFQLGGHSLKAIQVASLVGKKLNVELSLKDFFAHPVIEDLAVLLSGCEGKAYAAPEPAAEQLYYDLSRGQRMVWSKYHYSREKLAFNMRRVHAFDFLDPEVLAAVFRTLMERHEGLRTTFTTVDGEPKQRIHRAEDLPFAIEYMDLHGEEDVRSTVNRMIAERVSQPFDRQEGPLFRVTLYFLGRKGYLMQLTIDHLVSDAWSIDVLEKEALLLYETYARGEASPLTPLSIQYKDYAAWQLQWLAGPEAREYLAYWRGQLAPPIAALRLPVDYPPACSGETSYREALKQEMQQHFVALSGRDEENLYGAMAMVKPLKGSAYRVVIDGAVQQKLNALALEANATLFAVITTTINILMFQLTGERDIVIGTPVSLREREDFKGVIGWFLDTLLLRNCLDESATVREAVARAAQTNVMALQHRSYPFEKLLDDLDIPFPVVGRVFVHLLNFNSFRQDRIGEREFEPLHRTNGTPTFDINFTFGEYSNGIMMTCDYRSELFRPDTIEHIVGRYLDLLNAIVINPGATLLQLKHQFIPLPATGEMVG